MVDKTLLRKFFAEFIGTMMFVYVGVGSVISHNVSAGDGLINVSLGFGLGLAIVVSMVADISGGHINPAVTWALVISRNLDPLTGVGYVISQLLGSIVGAGLLKLSTGDYLTQGVGVNLLGGQISYGEGIMLEAILTFFLVFTVFSVAVQKTSASHIAPLVIGFSVMAAHCCTIGFTGASLNPARSFGPALVEWYFRNHSVFWLGPLIGATAAPPVFYLIYDTVNPDDVQFVGNDGSDGLRLRGRGSLRDPELAEKIQKSVPMSSRTYAFEDE